MRFKIGQKIVCINDKNQYNETLSRQGDKVKEGVIYTVSALSIDDYGDEGVRLDDVDSGTFHNGGASYYRSDRFAPLEDIKEAEQAVNHLIKEIEIEQYQLN